MNIELVKGDDRVFDLTFVRNGVPVDITGWTIYFTAKNQRGDLDENACLSKDITNHENPTGGKTQLVLTHVETANIPDRLLYDIRVKDAGGLIMTLMVGDIIASVGVTQRTT